DWIERGQPLASRGADTREVSTDVELAVGELHRGDLCADVRRIEGADRVAGIDVEQHDSAVHVSIDFAEGPGHPHLVAVRMREDCGHLAVYVRQEVLVDLAGDRVKRE